jgi:hypothetical protein
MSRAEMIGVAIAAIGGAVTALNFYLYFLRYPLYRLLGGSPEHYRYSSGLPLFGQQLLWIGAAFLWTRPVAMWSVLAISLFDAAGLHVLAAVVATHYFQAKRRAKGNG